MPVPFIPFSISTCPVQIFLIVREAGTPQYTEAHQVANTDIFGQRGIGSARIEHSSTLKELI